MSVACWKLVNVSATGWSTNYITWYSEALIIWPQLILQSHCPSVPKYEGHYRLLNPFSFLSLFFLIIVVPDHSCPWFCCCLKYLFHWEVGRTHRIWGIRQGIIWGFFYLFKLEANYFTILQWSLPYIDMSQPWVHMCSPSGTPLLLLLLLSHFSRVWLCVTP